MPDTWDAIAERKRAKGKIMGASSTRLKEKLQAQYSKLNAKVKRSARADKKDLLRTSQQKQRLLPRNRSKAQFTESPSKSVEVNGEGRHPFAASKGHY